LPRTRVCCLGMQGKLLLFFPLPLPPCNSAPRLFRFALCKGRVTLPRRKLGDIKLWSYLIKRSDDAEETVQRLKESHLISSRVGGGKEAVTQHITIG
jgi:hypothetical protein